MVRGVFIGDYEFGGDPLWPLSTSKLSHEGSFGRCAEVPSRKDLLIQKPFYYSSFHFLFRYP